MPCGGNGPRSHGRAPLLAADVRAALARCGPGAGGAPGGARPWPQPRLVAATGSTNADLAAAAAAGAAEGSVLVAEEQTTGRGRLGRAWACPPGAGLLWSVLLRPAVPVGRWGWLPLLAGVAVAGALRAATGVPAALKWPNDLVVDGPARDGGPGPRKLAGILAEGVAGGRGAPGAVVVGCGLNVSLAADELPVPAATSLALEGGAPPGRADLLAACLAGLAARYAAWSAADGDPAGSGLLDAYLALCLTPGRRVRASLPDGRVLEGRALGVDDAGRLLLGAGGAGGGPVALAAADVVHLR